MHLSSLFPDGTNGVIFTFMSTFPLSMSGVSHTTVSYFLNAKSRLQSANDLFAILSCLILVRLISLISTPSSNGFTSPRSLPFSYIRLCPENTRSDVDSYIPADTYTYPHRQSDDTLPISLCLYAAFPMTSFDAERLSMTSAPAMARSLPGETGVHASSHISMPSLTLWSPLPISIITLLPNSTSLPTALSPAFFEPALYSSSSPSSSGSMRLTITASYFLAENHLFS